MFVLFMGDLLWYTVIRRFHNNHNLKDVKHEIFFYLMLWDMEYEHPLGRMPILFLGRSISFLHSYHF